MNKKLSSIVSSTKSGPESGVSEGVKFKKLKIKQQKLKDKSTSLSSAVIGSSSSSLLVLTDSGPEFSSKDHLLSSLLYSLNQSILTIQSPLPPFLIPDHFKSFLKFSLKSSSSHNLTTQFPFPFSTRALSLIEAETLGTTSVPLISGNVNDVVDNLTAIPMPLPSWIKIKEYAPIVFASLRDKVYSFPTKTVFKESLLNPLKGPPSKVRDAESPRTMYVTSDCQLLIKTIDGSDLDGFLSLLKSLHPYLVQRKPGALQQQQQSNTAGIALAGSPPPTPACLVNSLLPQYMAVYRLSYAGSHSFSSMIASTVTSGTSGLIGSASKVSSSDSHFYFVVMRNPLSSDESFFPIHYFYNVTADGVKRKYTQFTGGTGAPMSTGRDEKKHSSVNTSISGDCNSDFTLTLKKDDAERLLSNLEADLKFLCSHLLVGYSLSIGIHSIDLWERELAEDEDDDDDDGEEEEESSLVASITQQFQGLRTTAGSASGVTTSPPQATFTGMATVSSNAASAVRKSLRCKKRKESLSLVIDPLRHPFALPSPFVGVDSRASSRPSLHSEQSECDSGLVGDASRSNGRFVYWVGFCDLLPLSASFSSKEIREFRERVNDKVSKKDKEKASKATANDTDKDNNLHGDDSLPYDSGASGTGETGTVTNTGKPSKEAKEEMGKKEAAREYSKNLLNQMRRRIRIVEQ